MKRLTQEAMELVAGNTLYSTVVYGTVIMCETNWVMYAADLALGETDVDYCPDGPPWF